MTWPAARQAIRAYAGSALDARRSFYGLTDVAGARCATIARSTTVERERRHSMQMTTFEPTRRPTGDRPAGERRPRPQARTVAPGRDQRAALLAATAEVISRRGAESATVELICATARVSRSTFYAAFADRADCLLAAFDEVAERISAAALGACRREQRWIDGVHAACSELLAFLDADPRRARFILLDSPGPAGPLRARRAELLARFERALADTAPATLGEAPAAPYGPDALVAALARIVCARVRESPASPLRELAGRLTALIALSYLGAEAAREQAGREPRTPPARAQLRAGPELGTLDRIGLRPTYRVVGALGAIAREPGMSNRAVAEAAAIADQGQASKLLARLERLGAIESRGAHRGRGHAHAWHLTAAGAEVLRELGLPSTPGGERDSGGAR